MSSSKLVEVLESINDVSTHVEYEPVEDLIYEFLWDRTPLTEKSYRSDLQSFFEFTTKELKVPRLISSKCHFEDIRRVHIVKYKKFLKCSTSTRGRPFSPNTINRKISAVASFFQFLLRREMKNLFDLVIEEAPPLHKAIILLLFTTGMRQAELRNIKRNDFIMREGIRFLNYMGKGQKS